MLNRAEIIGRLTRNPELRYTPTGKPVAQMAIATNADLGKDENGERRETVEYHDVVMWGTTAETTARYLSKGRRVFVEGRLQTRSWEHEGITRRRTEIVASRVQFLDAAKAGTEFTGPQLKAIVTILEEMEDSLVILERRGYSITRDAQGKVVADAARVAEGDVLQTTLARGWIESQVRRKG